MILALLTEVVAFHMRLPIIEIGEPSLQLSFSVAGGFGTNGLSLKDRIYVDLRHRLKVFLGILGGSRDWSIRRSCIAWFPCSEESPSSSGSLCPAERGGFLRGRGAIIAKFGIV